MSKISNDKTLHIYRDRVACIHARPQQSATISAKRFREFLDALMNGKIDFSSSNTSVMANLIAFDGVVELPSLKACAQAISGAYRLDDNVALEFTTDKGPDRRFLSHFTCHALSKITSIGIDVEQVLVDLDKDISAFYLQPIGSSLNVLLNDARNWLFEVLPPSLFFHCVGELPLAPLARAAWVRHETQQVEVGNEGENTTNIEASGIATAIEAYFNAEKEDGGVEFLKQIMKSSRAKKYENPSTEKRRMLGECMRLVVEARFHGPIVALLSAWGIDLIESGTPWTQNLHPGTPGKYINTVCLALFYALRGQDIDQLTAEKFEEIYSGVMNSVELSSKLTASAAISSFHWFLVRWFDVPNIRMLFPDGKGWARVSANIVWRHESERLLRWLAESNGDERLNAQLKVILLILIAVRMRAGDIYCLRIGSIRILENHIEIDISPTRSDPLLKTRSARRTVYVREPSAFEEVKKWRDRRNAEGAFPQDRLFGDPYRPTKWYKWGATYTRINALLKIATGDLTVSLHTFSHTWISERIANTFLEKRTIDINPLDEIGTEAGHASAQTSLTNYFHLFEQPLRTYLDRALQTIALTSASVASYAYTTAGSVRQRRSRSKEKYSASDIDWKLIVHANSSEKWPAVDNGYNLREPLMPPWLEGTQILSLPNLIHVLSDFCDGISLEAVALRAGMEQAQVLCIAGSATRTLNKLKVPLEEAEYLGDGESVFMLSRFGKVQKDIDFSRIGQDKYAALTTYISANGASDVVAEGIKSWAKVFSRSYLDFSRPTETLGLIAVMHAAGVPIDQLAICVQPVIALNEKIDTTLRHIRSLFASSYGQIPLCESRQPRRGRPAVYLVFSGQPLCQGHTLQSASISVAGMHALILSAAVWIDLSKRSATEIDSAVGDLKMREGAQ